MFDVVSWPASSSRPAMPTSSSSVSSSPCSRISMPRMSSPGWLRALATSDCMYARLLRCISIRSAIGSERSSWRAERAWKSARSSYGTPSSSQITSEGMGSAKCSTRSTGAPGGRHRVEVLLDDLGDPRFQPLDPPDGELRGQHAAQPLVLRRVEAEQVARSRAGRAPPPAVSGAPGMHEPRRPRVGEVLGGRTAPA